MKKVLMVDSDCVNLMMAQEALADKYKVYMINSGKLIVQYTEVYKPDLVLISEKMPYMDGIEALERVRRIDPFMKIPVAIITPKKNKELISKTGGLGVLDYLVRPFGANVLRKRVDEMFQFLEANSR